MFSATHLFAHLGHLYPEPEKDGGATVRQFVLHTMPTPVFVNQRARRQYVVLTTQVNEGR